MKLGCMLVAVAALAGCGKGAADKGEPAADKGAPVGDKAVIDAAPVADAACLAQVAELQEWMAALAGAGQVELDFPIKLVEAPLPAGWVPEADVVQIATDAVGAWDVDEVAHAYIEGLEVRGALEKRLAETLAKKDRPGPGDILRVDIAPAVMWSRVVEVAEAATKVGYRRLLVVFKAAPPVPRPAASAIRARLEAGDSAVDAEVWKTCNAVMSYFLQRAPGDRSARELADEEVIAVPAGIAGCACAVDFAMVRDALWSSSVGNGSGSHRAAVMIDLVTPGLEATTVKLAGKTPWAEAAPKVIEAARAARPVRFAR